MPSKAQRAASRQARLSRRKRRGKAAPQNFQAGPTQSTAVSDAPVAAPSRPARQSAAVAPRAPGPAPSRARAATRPGRRAVEAGPSHVERYLGRELRQIGIITILIAAILGGLTFVLA